LGACSATERCRSGAWGACEAEMKTGSLFNPESGECLLATVKVAERFLDRLVGLMGRKSLPQGEGLFFPRCAAVHMLFMRFPIDAVYLDAEGRVKKVVRGLKPWRLSLCPGADSVLEAPEGWASLAGVEEGMRLELRERQA